MIVEDVKSQDLKLACWILRRAEGINFSPRAEEPDIPAQQSDKYCAPVGQLVQLFTTTSLSSSYSISVHIHVFD